MTDNKPLMRASRLRPDSSPLEAVITYGQFVDKAAQVSIPWVQILSAQKTADENLTSEISVTPEFGLYHDLETKGIQVNDLVVQATRLYTQAISGETVYRQLKIDVQNAKKDYSEKVKEGTRERDLLEVSRNFIHLASEYENLSEDQRSSFVSDLENFVSLQYKLPLDHPTVNGEKRRQIIANIVNYLGAFIDDREKHFENLDSELTTYSNRISNLDARVHDSIMSYRDNWKGFYGSIQNLQKQFLETHSIISRSEIVSYTQVAPTRTLQLDQQIHQFDGIMDDIEYQFAELGVNLTDVPSTLSTQSSPNASSGTEQVPLATVLRLAQGVDVKVKRLVKASRNFAQTTEQFIDKISESGKSVRSDLVTANALYHKLEQNAEKLLELLKVSQRYIRESLSRERFYVELEGFHGERGDTLARLISEYERLQDEVAYTKTLKNRVAKYEQSGLPKQDKLVSDLRHFLSMEKRLPLGHSKVRSHVLSHLNHHIVEKEHESELRIAELKLYEEQMDSLSKSLNSHSLRKRKLWPLYNNQIKNLRLQAERMDELLSVIVEHSFSLRQRYVAPREVRALTPSHQEVEAVLDPFSELERKFGHELDTQPPTGDDIWNIFMDGVDIPKEDIIEVLSDDDLLPYDSGEFEVETSVQNVPKSSPDDPSHSQND